MFESDFGIDLRSATSSRELGLGRDLNEIGTLRNITAIKPTWIASVESQSRHGDPATSVCTEDAENILSSREAHSHSSQTAQSPGVHN